MNREAALSPAYSKQRITNTRPPFADKPACQYPTRRPDDVVASSIKPWQMEGGVVFMPESLSEDEIDGGIEYQVRLPAGEAKDFIAYTPEAGVPEAVVTIALRTFPCALFHVDCTPPYETACRRAVGAVVGPKSHADGVCASTLRRRIGQPMEA